MVFLGLINRIKDSSLFYVMYLIKRTLFGMGNKDSDQIYCPFNDQVSFFKRSCKFREKSSYSFKSECKSIVFLVMILSMINPDNIFGLKKYNRNHIVSFLFGICGVSTGCVHEDFYQGRSYTNQQIYITNCFFRRSQTYKGDGGVIYAKGGSYNLSIYSSMFYYCVCSSNGGAVFFDSTNIVAKFICASYCSAVSYNFAYICASENVDINYLSISSCSYTTSGNYALVTGSGHETLDNMNSSLNNAKFTSGILINIPRSFTSSHCTFSDNKVSNYMCIHFSDKSGIMSFANIIRNNSPSELGVVYSYGSYKMHHCIFSMNQNTLFSGSLEVAHSFISHSGSFSSGGIVTELNNSFFKAETYQIQYFQSYYCNADDPFNERYHKFTYSHQRQNMYPIILLILS